MARHPVNFLHQQTEKNKAPTPRWLIFLIIILLLVISGCLSRSIIGKEAPNDPTAYDPITLAPKKPEGFFNKLKNFILTKDNKLEGERNDRINILVLGMGGVGHDGPFLADTIIITSIKPSTGEVAMISIPRDLSVKIPGKGWYKINYANAYGEAKTADSGAEFTAKVVADNFDLDIHYYIRVDFRAFEEIIDEIGGITINVERAFVDHMYPAEANEYQTIEFNRGAQIMDGKTALIFVRSRHGSNGEGSDFARAKRQQKILLALKEKLLSFSAMANPLRINNIRKSLTRHITSNLEFTDIMSLLQLAKEVNTDKIINLILDTSPDGYLQEGYSSEDAFILEPKSGNFKDIKKIITNIFEAVPMVKVDTPEQLTPALPTANIEIQNGTWIVGMAARIKKRLEDRDFTVSNIGNTEERPQATSGIYNVSDKNLSSVLKALQEELRIPFKENLPIGISPTSSTEIFIILGEDIKE